MTEKKLRVLAYVLFFTVAFMSIGWLMPALTATYIPADNYIEVHSYQTNNASLDDATHMACFDRTISAQATGEVYTEMYLVKNGDDKERIQVTAESVDRHFEKGRATVRISTDLPETVKPGEYYYERTYNMELANGKVSRIFTFHSEMFHLTENSSEPPPC